MNYAALDLAAGTYTGYITVTVEDPLLAFRKSQKITVTLTVTAGLPVLSVSTTSLSLSCQQGENVYDTFAVQNTGGGTLTYSITGDQTWFSCYPANGTSTGEQNTITVTCATSGLELGTYTGYITVEAPGAIPIVRYILVSLTVTDAPAVLSVSPTGLSTKCELGQNTANQFTVQNTGGGTLTYTITGDQTWFSCTPASGTSTGEKDTIAVNYAASSLAVGTYTSYITITAPGATGSPRTIPITLTVVVKGGLDGTQKWASPIGLGSVYSSPAMGTDGTIYVGSVENNNSKLIAVNPFGTQEWAFATGIDVDSSPTLGADGTIYVGVRNGKLFALNPNGTQKWVFITSISISASPAISTDGTIYVGSDKLYALNPDGTQKWAFTGGYILSSPAIGADGTIYVGTSKLYALNPDGTQKWVFATGSAIYSSSAIGADGTIYMGSGGKLYALNPDGTQKWAFDTGRLIVSSPAIGADGTIYVGSSKYDAISKTYSGTLYAITANGTQKWAFATGGWIESSPAIGGDGTIYVGSHDKNLYALNPDGTQKWAFATGREIHSSPAISTDGTIYVGSYDGNLYAVYSSSRGLAKSPWPMFHHDVRHTGRAPVNMAPIIGLLLGD